MYISHTFYPSIVNDEMILFDFQMTWNKTCYEKHVYLIVYIFILIFCSINISLLHHFYNIMLSLFESNLFVLLLMLIDDLIINHRFFFLKRLIFIFSLLNTNESLLMIVILPIICTGWYFHIHLENQIMIDILCFYDFGFFMFGFWWLDIDDLNFLMIDMFIW